MQTRRLRPVALVLAGASFLVACGGDDKGRDSSSESRVPADVAVTAIDGIKWDKAEYTATSGDVTILLRNESSLPHTLALVAEGGSKVGPELKTNSRGNEDTGTYPLEAGTYTIICTVAGHGGMKADLVVT